jgi:hypothetical protein
MLAIFRSAASRFASAVTGWTFSPDHRALAALDAADRLCSGDMFSALRFPPIFPPLLPISAITDFAPLPLEVPATFLEARTTT